MNSYQFLQATVQSDINDTNSICQDVQQANNNKYYLKVILFYNLFYFSF